MEGERKKKKAREKPLRSGKKLWAVNNYVGEIRT